MTAFVTGFCVASFWAVLIVPVLIVKSAFTLPLD